MAQVDILMPAFNESQGLALAVQTVEQHLAPTGHAIHFVLVDDGSRDRTWEVIADLAAARHDVTGVGFARNFGKEAALAAGLERCTGDCVIVLDADLQHPPEVLPQLLRAWKEENYQIVHGIKRQRHGESLFRRVCSRLVFGAAHALSGLNLQASSDYKLLDRQVVAAFQEFRERHLFFRGLIDWLGFRSTKIEFDVAERAVGTSQWGVWGLARYALSTIFSFTTKPLKLVALLALMFAVIATGAGGCAMLAWILGDLPGSTLAVILLLVGFGDVAMVGTCAISWYVGRIYEEVRMRPRYVVARTVGRTAANTNNASST